MAVITPAATNVGEVQAYCARLENMSRSKLLKMGLDGTGLEPTTAEAALGITAGGIAAQALQMGIDGYTTFKYEMRTETNDALVINLTDDLGVNFLTADTFRRVDLEVYASADADYGFVPQTFIVQGASTPVVATTLQTAVADIGLTTIESGLLKSVAAGDLLNSGAVRNLAVPSQSSNDIIVTYTGVSNLDLFATLLIKVYPLVYQESPVTD